MVENMVSMQEELRQIAAQQARTLLPADQVRESTNQKVNQFILGHQEKIVTRIKAAADLGRFKIEYEINAPSSAEVMDGLRSNLEAAGYKVTPHKHTHNPTWTISWDAPTTRGTSMIMG